MRRISKTLMLQKLAKLPDGLPLSAISTRLLLSERTLRRWTKDKKFIDAGGAEKRGGSWYFDSEVLKAWIIAVLPMSGRDVQENPPKSEARNRFKLPEGYRVKQ